MYVFLNNTAHIYFAIKFWILQKKISLLTQSKDSAWWQKYCLLVAVFLLLDFLSPIAINLYVDHPKALLKIGNKLIFSVLCTAPQAMTSVVICYCFYQFRELQAWNTAISKSQMTAQLLSNIVYALSDFALAF